MDKKNTCFFIFVLLLSPCSVQSATTCSKWLAKVISIQGKVDSQFSGRSDWQPVDQNEQFCDGDKIRTAKASRVTIQMGNQTRITLEQGTTMAFLAAKKQSSSWYLNLLKGEAFFRSRQTQHLDIHTPFINAVHKGTEFLVSVKAEKTEITVFDGKVVATNAKGEILIKKGFIGIATKNKSPIVKPLTVRPEDAVQWALYYPPIIDFQTLDPSKTELIQPVINAYQQGNLYQALTQLDVISESLKDINYLSLKASLLLAVGSVEEALDLINTIQIKEPDNSTTIAFKSIILVTKNRKKKALKLAHQAVKLDSQSAVAQITLSYAYQAMFKINLALKATQEAVRLSPHNALAWARLSELQLSQGKRKGALASAKKAQKLSPQLDRIQTILGFAYLANVEMAEARSAFTSAIKKNLSDPLAWLGLGLTKIRVGDIKEGTRDLETAVSLNLDRAVMRSYLGKAYYELKNETYAATELTLAKGMDPKDPTPWYYDAILKQTTNRPVEALHAMQKAIELNDNRAVYRSSLLLDEDLAARSASLGRIYNDLGFQQLGLIQGWKSMNIDPSNYSTHRLLADNYAALPRHEVARVSELLQSQLLQPINITPIQPLLSENSVHIIDGLAPSASSFNEFNPLFTSNRLTYQASGFLGGNDTWGEEVVQSGVWDQFSYSLGQHHYETEGFRTNNFLERDVYNIFVQDQVTKDLNLQAEYKYENRKNGDLSYNFDATDFSESFNENRKVVTYRIGGRYKVSLSNILLGSLIYQDINISQNSLLPFLPIPIENKIARNGVTAEMQNIYKHDYFTVTSGFSHINHNVKTEHSGLVTNPDVFNTNLYSYWLLHPFQQLSITVGAALNFFEIDDEIKQTSLCPKVGVEWQPIVSTRVRLAGFCQKSISRTAAQTIEPTHVAGFNQLFDDPLGSDVWRYGFAIDHTFSPKWYMGLEYSEKIINAHRGGAFFDWKEQLGRTYLYWTPSSYVAMRMEYSYERFDRDEQPFDTGIIDVKTHKIPVSLNFFHKTGVSMKVKGTYVSQDGNFFRNSNPTNPKYTESDQFFLVDTHISYRLPRRHGMIDIGINNLFNQKFNFQNTNIESPLFSPERFLFGRFTLAF